MGRNTISRWTGSVDALSVSRVFASFDGRREGRLGALCLSLLEEQKKTWIECQRGYESLVAVVERTLNCSSFSVIVQHNRGRVASTEARIGEGDIARRPCFLCPDSLPAGQKAVLLYGGDYAVLCNPMPVFSSHFTVAYRTHRPQTISGNGAAFLQLTGDFGEGWTVLYNGPRCGASAPDHLHFQVVPAGRMPIEKEIAEEGRLVLVKRTGDVGVYRADNLGREVVMLVGNSPADLLVPFSSCLAALAGCFAPGSPPGRVDSVATEPMVNLAGFCRGGKAILLIFPRRVHRPGAFFLSGDERIAVSPAVAEMGGIIVTPVERDFVRLDADVIEGVYREVSVDASTIGRVIEAM
jgi:hypothetical protein